MAVTGSGADDSPPVPPKVLTVDDDEHTPPCPAGVDIHTWATVANMPGKEGAQQRDRLTKAVATKAKKKPLKPRKPTSALNKKKKKRKRRKGGVYYNYLALQRAKKKQQDDTHVSGPGTGQRKLDPARRRPGMVAMREIRHYQKTTEVLLRRLPFARLVREVQMHVYEDPKYHAFRWKAEALHALQEAAEGFLVNLLEDCNLMAMHTRRITIMSRDLQLVRRVRRLTFG